MSQALNSELNCFSGRIGSYGSFEYEAAIANFDKALAIQANLYEAWYNRGCAMFFLHRYKEASR
jgi:tetratricopeptide (TPR) repeat protein